MGKKEPTPASWKKGQSGNPRGRPPKGTSLTELLREFSERTPEKLKITYKEALVKKMFELALVKGDMVAMKLIWNYMEGMPPQKIETTGKLDLRVLHRLAREAKEELEKEEGEGGS